MQVDIPVSWSGGLTSTLYETVYSWRLDDKGGSTLVVTSDSAPIVIDQAHLTAAANYLSGKRAKLDVASSGH